MAFWISAGLAVFSSSPTRRARCASSAKRNTLRLGIPAPRSTVSAQRPRIRQGPFAASFRMTSLSASKKASFRS